MIRRIRLLAAVHLVGNALLLWLGYYWLGIGESRALTLAWSVTVALVLLCAACWLHGATFTYFREGPSAFRTTLRRLLPVVVAAVAVLVVYALLSKWQEYSSRPAFGIASWLTLKLRKPVKPASVLRAFNAALWLVRWIVVPVFVMPLVADIASLGWSGARAFGRLAKSWRYWIATPVLLVCALWLPFRILGWVPQVGGFGVEMASFVVRILAAYLLFTAAWLLLAFLTSRGKPDYSVRSASVG